MVRMTNNSMASAPASSLLDVSNPSPAKPRTIRAARPSRPAVPIFKPSTIREEPESEPPKRALSFERPPRQVGYFVNGIDLLQPPQQYPPTRSRPQQASSQFATNHTLGLLPSPTFSSSVEHVHPGLWTDHRDGHNFVIDQEMIDAAQTLLSISRSNPTGYTQHVTAGVERSIRDNQLSPFRFETSSVRDDEDQQTPYQSWNQGDARRHIVDSGLSPKARRIRDAVIGISEKLNQVPLTDKERRHLMQTYADDIYFNNPILKAINDSPPKRRQAESSSNVNVDSEDDVTEVEYDGDVDMKDSDYQASSPYQPYSSPIRGVPPYRDRDRMRLLGPPRIAQRKERLEDDNDDDESSSVTDDNSADSADTEISDCEAKMDSSPIRGHRRRGWSQLRRQPVRLSAVIEDSEDESEQERSETPPQPSTSPMSRIPSRAESREQGSRRGYLTPASENLQPVPSSSSSLDKWLEQARESQSHRSEAFLKPFLERAKQQFLNMQNEEEDDDDDDDNGDGGEEMQLESDVITQPAVVKVSTPWLNGVSNVEVLTPASSGMEEGEIVDDGASDATTIVSPTKQHDRRSRYQRAVELNY